MYKKGNIVFFIIILILIIVTLNGLFNDGAQSQMIINIISLISILLLAIFTYSFNNKKTKK